MPDKGKAKLKEALAKKITDRFKIFLCSPLRSSGRNVLVRMCGPVTLVARTERKSVGDLQQVL